MAVTAGACFDVDGGNLRLSQYAGLRVTPAELPFDGRSQVLQQMKAVRYLPSLRRTPSHTLCIEAAPVPAEQLQHFSSSDREVAEAILREVLPKLHQIAVRELRRERSIAQLSPTELINEVWLRNLGKGGWQVNSRNHFYAIAALAMRRVLIDFARARMAQRRRGEDIPGGPDEAMSLQAAAVSPESMVHIGMLMDSLEKVDKEWARVVDTHYFAGFTLEEIAEITGLSLRQIRVRWEKGRDWLKDRLR